MLNTSVLKVSQVQNVTQTNPSAYKVKTLSQYFMCQPLLLVETEQLQTGSGKIYSEICGSGQMLSLIQLAKVPKKHVTWSQILTLRAATFYSL